jgi:molybdate transport system ATP-binding protein
VPGAPLVEVEDAEVRLAGRTLLGPVTFTLREGERWALVGPNGSGKTSLLRLLRGELWPFPRGRRTFRFLGEAQESPIGARERIGFVSPELQDVYARRDWDLRAEKVVLGAFTDSVYPQEEATAEQEARIDEVLEALGIGALRGRRVLELSTGERRRVLLARALATRPRILLLDEATEGLDAASRAAFLAAASAAARAGTALVVATHRAEEVVPEVNRVAVLEGGRIVRVGGRELAIAATAPAATTTAIATSTATTSPAPAQPSRARDLAPERDERARGSTAEPLLTLRGVSVHLDDGTPVLRDVTWELRDGESWAILGANGAGKSSFLKLLAGDLRELPGGAVLRRGLERSADRDRIQAGLGLVSPELQARHVNDLPVLDVVVSGLRGSIGIDGAPGARERDAAREALLRASASHLLHRTVLSISYGELRRVLLARALVRRPRLLLLDEPFAGLDPRSRAAFAAALEALAEGGVQLLIAAHHDEDLVPAVGHVLVLDRGRVVRRGARP